MLSGKSSTFPWCCLWVYAYHVLHMPLTNCSYTAVVGHIILTIGSHAHTHWWNDKRMDGWMLEPISCIKNCSIMFVTMLFTMCFYAKLSVIQPCTSVFSKVRHKAIITHTLVEGQVIITSQHIIMCGCVFVHVCERGYAWGLWLLWAYENSNEAGSQVVPQITVRLCFGAMTVERSQETWCMVVLVSSSVLQACLKM